MFFCLGILVTHHQLLQDHRNHIQSFNPLPHTRSQIFLLLYILAHSYFIARKRPSHCAVVSLGWGCEVGNSSFGFGRRRGGIWLGVLSRYPCFPLVSHPLSHRGQMHCGLSWAPLAFCLSNNAPPPNSAGTAQRPGLSCCSLCIHSIRLSLTPNAPVSTQPMHQGLSRQCDPQTRV